MKDCTVQVKPPLVLHRRRPYRAKTQVLTPSVPAVVVTRRRGLLKFWDRARQHHVLAREAWRKKLNRYLLP